MSILDTVSVGAIVPLDQFPIKTMFDRVVVPVQNAAFLGAKKSFVPDGFGAARLDPPSVSMQTYERTMNGWRRIR